MAIKINAREQYLKVGKVPGYYYVMLPELYTALSKEKVIKEAAIRSGVSEGVMSACWDAAGEVIKAWATEGHSVALPGLGTMRFTVRSKAVADVNDVKSNLIKTRRIVFTPASEVKEELAKTAIQITCYDRNGTVVKRVTSTSGEVEDGESPSPDSPEGEGTNTGGNTSGGGSQTPTIPTLTITKNGTGTATVKVGGNAVNSGSQIGANTQVDIEVTPASGQVPTATIGGQSVTLTNDGGTYTGSFNMPSADATLVINSGSNGSQPDDN